MPHPIDFRYGDDVFDEAPSVQPGRRPPPFTASRATGARPTLVHLAKRESLTAIFTINHDDFETYRIDGKHQFRIVPSR